MEIEPDIRDSTETMANSVTDELIGSKEATYLEPSPGMEFESDEDAKLWYNEYARHVGFSIRVGRNERSRRSKEIISKMFVCFKEGIRDRKHLNREDRIRRERPQVRVGCKAMIMIKKRGPNKWVLTRFVKEHNHELVSHDRVPLLRSHKRPSNTMRCPIIQVQGVNMMSVVLDKSYVQPILKTQFPMEEQIANLYTKTMFFKFQEELTSSLSYVAIKYKETGELHMYQVRKFGEESNLHFVTLNTTEIRASCTCRMFEFVRILCRHALIVFRMTNVMLLPSHYICGRYIRDEKGGNLYDDYCDVVQADYRETAALRYTDLCQQAIKYAEEGATSVTAYNVAVRALQRSLEEVRTEKRSVSASTDLLTQFSGNIEDDGEMSGGSQVVHSTDGTTNDQHV